MTRCAPLSYWRRHVRHRCSLRCAMMTGAFIGMAMGMIALVMS